MRRVVTGTWVVTSSVVVAVMLGCGGQSSTRDEATPASGGHTSTAGGSGSAEAGKGGATAEQGGASTGAVAPGGAGGRGGAGGASEAGATSAGAPAGGASEAGAAGAATCDDPNRCAPSDGELVLSHDSKSCPSAALRATATATYFIGGIDRIVLHLSWACSDFGELGEPSRAELELRVTIPSMPPISEVEHTFTSPPPSGMSAQYLFGQSDLWVRGSGLPEIESKLTHVESEVSLRRAGGLLIGSVHYVGTSVSGARAVLRAPFEVADPTP
jgi:hypothetical protein